MTLDILMPAVSANEDEVLLVQWHAADGAPVSEGQMLCSVETTKATVEVEAESDGYLHHVAAAGTKVRTGEVIARLSDTAEGTATTEPSPVETPKIHTPAPEPRSTDTVRKWTRKAEILAGRAGLEIHEIFERLGGRTVTEKDIRAAIENGAAEPIRPQSAKPPPARPSSTPAQPARILTAGDLLDDAYPEGRPQRIVLLGGGAGAGAMTMDILSRSRRQRAVAILDNNPEVHGRTVGGAPIVGPCAMAEELWRSGQCDAVVLLITKDLYERAELFGKLSARGVPFANVIDPTTEIRAGVKLGQGNLVMARCYFSTGVQIGDNNFFGTHTVVEHHSTVGSHCTFGPRTTTSGAVKIGDRVKTGMSVSVEPYIGIGDDTLVASGCIITTDIPSRSVVKAQTGHVVRARDVA